MDFVNSIVDNISDFLSGYILFVVFSFAGVYFSLKTGFVQIKLLFDGLRSLKEKADGEATSSFQALMISTASRVGVGNIAGVSTAIVAGGPGAVFWMWIMAILSSASAFMESTLAQMYKIEEDGEFRGGPAYYMERVLKKRWLGSLFAILLIMCFAYGFNALQAYNISSSVEHYIPHYKETPIPIFIGIALSAVTAYVIMGGIHRIRFITSYLVPVMAVGYMGLGIFIILNNATKIPEMFSSIISNAFDFQSILGGFTGSCLMIGIKRGLFSNEAGMGSAANAAAVADVSHPVKQGLVQVISVFIDTLLMCSTTAFIILLSGSNLKNDYDGIRLVQSAIESEIGELGIHFITLAIFFFAFSSVVGNYFYAESNILFLKDSKILLNVFRISCLIPIVLGTISESSTVWNIADILMSLIALLNIIVLFLIGNRAILCLKDYIKQKKEGKDPSFKATRIGLNDTFVWK